MKSTPSEPIPDIYGVPDAPVSGDIPPAGNNLANSDETCEKISVASSSE